VYETPGTCPLSPKAVPTLLMMTTAPGGLCGRRDLAQLLEILSTCSSSLLNSSTLSSGFNAYSTMGG
jgi:hypothetical protein